MSNNPNHPKLGSHITIEPIRNSDDIKTIKQMLENKPRDYLLFVMGINNGLRVGDLLKLKIKDVAKMKAGESITIRESKTRKTNILVINKAVCNAISKYIKALKDKSQLNQGGYLFASRKSGNPLTIQAVNALVKKWTRTIHLKGNYGAHTLRKTWGYHQRVRFGVGFEIIAKRFNHTNPAVTMRYLGIEDKEIHETLMNEI